MCLVSQILSRPGWKSPQCHSCQGKSRCPLRCADLWWLIVGGRAGYANHEEALRGFRLRTQPEGIITGRISALAGKVQACASKTNGTDIAAFAWKIGRPPGLAHLGVS